jgi:hypothetical protein
MCIKGNDELKREMNQLVISQKEQNNTTQNKTKKIR